MATAFNDASRGGYRGGRSAGHHGRRGGGHTGHGDHNHGGPRYGTVAHTPDGADSTPHEAAGRPRPAERRLADEAQPRGPDDTPDHQWKLPPTSPLAPRPRKRFPERSLTELPDFLFSYVSPFARFDGARWPGFRIRALIMAKPESADSMVKATETIWATTMQSHKRVTVGRDPSERLAGQSQARISCGLVGAQIVLNPHSRNFKFGCCGDRVSVVETALAAASFR